MRKQCEKMRKSGPRPPQKMSNKVVPDLRIFPSCVQVVSKRSKRRPTGPKSVPRAFQERPRAPQKHPRAPEKPPRATREWPKSPRGAPNVPAEVRFLCFSSFSYVLWRFSIFWGVCFLFLRFGWFFYVGLFLFLQVCEFMSRDTRFWGELPIVG